MLGWYWHYINELIWNSVVRCPCECCFSGAIKSTCSKIWFGTTSWWRIKSQSCLGRPKVLYWMSILCKCCNQYVCCNSRNRSLPCFQARWWFRRSDPRSNWYLPYWLYSLAPFWNSIYILRTWSYAHRLRIDCPLSVDMAVELLGVWALLLINVFVGSIKPQQGCCVYFLSNQLIVDLHESSFCYGLLRSKA